MTHIDFGLFRVGKCPKCGGFMARCDPRTEDATAKCLNCGYRRRHAKFTPYYGRKYERVSNP